MKTSRFSLMLLDFKIKKKKPLQGMCTWRLKGKDKLVLGRDGVKLGEMHWTDRTGGGALWPYVPVGTKRIGKVRARDVAGHTPVTFDFDVI